MKGWARAVIVAISCSAITSACDDSGTPPMLSCEQIEVAQYPGMEAAAKEVLRDVDHRRLVRVGLCRDTGQPGATLNADVDSWETTRQALSYFVAQGWIRHGRQMVDADGKYRATFSKLVNGDVFVTMTVSFRLA